MSEMTKFRLIWTNSRGLKPPFYLGRRFGNRRSLFIVAANMNTVTGSTAEQVNTTPADVVVRGNASGFLQDVVTGQHHLRADEPVQYGGGDLAPGPYDYLLIGLGVCTSMTVGLYARRKQIPLENITVSLRHSRIHAKDCEEGLTKEGMLDRIDVEVELSGSLTPEQRAKLMDVAGKCPVHRTLKSEIDIRLRPA